MPIPPGQFVALEQLQQRLHDRLADFQPGYFASHGKNWQGVEIRLAAPDLRRRPTDQMEDWHVLGFTVPPPMAGNVRVDVYESPDGWGYSTSVVIEEGDGRWVNTVTTGPEDRETDWVFVEDDEF